MCFHRGGAVVIWYSDRCDERPNYKTALRDSQGTWTSPGKTRTLVHVDESETFRSQKDKNNTCTEGYTVALKVKGRYGEK